ncbi:MAG: hypothetical protein E6J72_05600 [Deltaproteobacteria bacterium]|nr:MAG: hypothetical protein E6J72_05600 [Deltaproteobacteria bacterium]
MTGGGRSGRVVVLGITAQYPMAGVTWQAMHYLAGLRALGCDVFYVEDSGAPPYDPASGGVAIDPSPNVAYLATVMRRLDLAERWAYWDAQRDVWHGLDAPQVRALYGSADAIFNLCGATRLRPEHRQGARLCYVETDPIYEQMRVANGDADSIAFLAEHDLLFTYGELLGTPSCTVPVERFTWIPTRPPVALDEWAPRDPGTAYRTIATWENKGKNVEFRGETYQWTKHLNFLRMIDVPRQARTRVELAMDPLDAGVRADLETHGWTLVDPRPISADVDAYRGFVEGARGELTVAKDIYVRPRSGWFSDRSVCFLAAGRPVVTQETGFSERVPSGRGLLAFATVEEAAAALRTVEGDYASHARAAREIAAEYFAAERVLGAMLDAAGIG